MDNAATEALIALLLPHRELSMAEIDVTRKPVPKQKAVAKQKKPALANDQLVEIYAEKLQACSGSSSEIEAVLGAIKSDRKIRAIEISGILTKIRGRDVESPTKAVGLKEIKQWFQRRRDTDRRIRGAEDVF